VLLDYDGTVLFVTHDRYLIDKLATEVWLVEAGALLRHEGTWTSLQRARALGLAAPPPIVASGSAGAIKPGEWPAEGPRERGGTTRVERVSAGAAGLGRDLTKQLEARISELEQRIKALEEQLAEVARTGNYMETRRVGEEHASLEKALRGLYDEWAARGEEK
jgi:ATP-binding cassette subfamily F protein 3